MRAEADRPEGVSQRALRGRTKRLERGRTVQTLSLIHIFVGLIVPHLVRFFVGHDNRWVLPLSAACGAAFVVLCDLLSRIMFAPYEVPVGILMAFLGGPFFIYLILKNRRRGLE